MATKGKTKKPTARREAADETTSSERLTALVEESDALARIVANNPSAPVSLLRVLSRSEDEARPVKAKPVNWLPLVGIEDLRRAMAGQRLVERVCAEARMLGGDDGATLTPSFELGLRLDGGDAEIGFGADLGGGLAFADPKHGLSLEFRARGLLAHESSGFREWGASAGLAWDPRPRARTGVCRCRCVRAGGVSPTGGMDALLGRETLAGLAANDNAGSGPGASG